VGDGGSGLVGSVDGGACRGVWRAASTALLRPMANELRRQGRVAVAAVVMTGNVFGPGVPACLATEFEQGRCCNGNGGAVVIRPGLFQR